MADVELKGFDELARGLNNAERLFLPLATQAMAISLEAILEAIQVIPPQPDRDRAWKPGRPHPYNTYVRNVGQYPHSAFAASSSAPGGYKVKMKKAGKIRYISQQSSKRWRMMVMAHETEVVGMLKNTATYSGYLWGSNQGGTPAQIKYHGETGWVAKTDAIEQAKPDMEQSFQSALNQFVAVLARL